MAKMRVFELGAGETKGAAPPVKELDPVTIACDGDKAKSAARLHLEEAGFLVRSINWAPGTHDAPVLVAYVTKKEGA